MALIYAPEGFFGKHGRRVTIVRGRGFIARIASSHSGFHGRLRGSYQPVGESCT